MPLRQFTCLQCNSEFVAKKLDAKYCSRACKHASQRGLILEKRCPHCQSAMRLRPSESWRKFCSVTCKYIATSDDQGQNRFGRKNGRSSFICQECGAEVATHKYLAERRRFCGEACAIQWRLRHTPARMAQFSCRWCRKEFERKQSYARVYADRIQFCSRECNGAYTARYKQNRVSMTETEFFDQLEKSGLRFKRQVRVRHFVVDAVCIDRNVAIEFDGEYWHSLQRIKEKDERKADAIAWAGYKLVRVPERDWLDSPEATVQRVLEEVRTL